MWIVFINPYLPNAQNNMRPAAMILICWLAAIWIEPTLSSLISWFHPNLMFLFSVLFCLHWRGYETPFIALLFGLTSDCFSSLPFGILGLTFFLFSFFLRWYAVKIFQESLLILPAAVGLFTFAVNTLILFALLMIFDEKYLSIGWIANLLLHEAIPTAIIAIPCYKFFLYLDRRLRIRLSERKF